MEGHEYTERDWLKKITISKGGALINRFDYKYHNQGMAADPTGHLRQEVDKNGQIREWFYNALYELTREKERAELNPPLSDVQYVYSPNGNRLTKQVTGPTNYTEYYGILPGNRLLWVNRVNSQPNRGQTNHPYTIFTYGADGEVIRRDRRTDGGVHQDLELVWDGDSRLKEVKQFATGALVFSAQYRGDGIRVQKSDTRNGVLTPHDYSYSPYGLIWDSQGSTQHIPGFGHSSGGANSFYHTDWIGSTRYVTDSDPQNLWTAALSYDAYGNRIGANPVGSHPSDLQYAGGWGYQTEWSSATDPGLGLQYLQQRYYDPAAGRFISPDPIGIAGGLNLYAYPSNPVGKVDPTGLAEIDRMGWWMMSYWLRGGGGAVSFKGADTYLQRSPELTDWVQSHLRDVAAEIRSAPAGTTQSFSFRTSNEDTFTLTTNRRRENWDGYTFLNGPNEDVGGFQLWGVATKTEQGRIEFKGKCVYNDIMDPNARYLHDRFWSRVGKIVTFGGAKDYNFQASWYFRSLYDPPGKANTGLGNGGWPWVEAR